MGRNLNRNRYFFGLGTIGKDMLYTMVSVFLIFYLTEIVNLSDATMRWITVALTALRIFDALNDPISGFIIDNTRTRFGKLFNRIICDLEKWGELHKD